MADASFPGGGTKTHRFAICLSGAVALGAYEAGVLAQLYRDIHTFNASAAGRARLVIDVIAGSSAGSVTGLILAQALALGDTPDEFERRMQDSWVDGLDLLALLEPTGASAQAFFTDESIRQIAARTLRKPKPDGVITTQDIIALWVTMTNLTGIPYSINFRRGADAADIAFYALSYRDYSPFLICGPNIRYLSFPLEQIGRTTWEGCRLSTWDEAQESAIASAAFPLGFQSRLIKRDLSLYPEYADMFRSDPRVLDATADQVTKTDPTDPRLPTSANFQFVDGGIFNNEPIGRAIDAAAYLLQVDAHRATDARTYLVIEPDPSTPHFIETLIGQASQGDSTGLPPAQVLGKIVSAYFYDALYRDFEDAAKTNTKLRQLDDTLQSLGLDQHREAITQAVGFAHKREVNLERIPWSIPLKDRLAGDFAGHFGGFLERDFRAYDFAVGRSEAREWMRQWLPREAATLLPDAEALGDLKFLAQTVDVPLPNLAEASWQTVPQQHREAIVQKSTTRVETLGGRWIPPMKPYWGVIRALVMPKVLHLLADAPSAGLNWLSAISALSDTSVARFVLLAWGVIAGLAGGAALGIGWLALQRGLIQAVLAGAAMGILLPGLVIGWLAYVAARHGARA